MKIFKSQRSKIGMMIILAGLLLYENPLVNKTKDLYKKYECPNRIITASGNHYSDALEFSRFYCGGLEKFYGPDRKDYTNDFYFKTKNCGMYKTNSWRLISGEDDANRLTWDRIE